MAEDPYEEKWYLNTNYNLGNTGFIPRPVVATNYDNHRFRDLKEETFIKWSANPVPPKRNDIHDQSAARWVQGPLNTNVYEREEQHTRHQEENVGYPLKAVTPTLPNANSNTDLNYTNAVFSQDERVRKGSIQAESVSIVTRSYKSNNHNDDVEALERSVAYLKLLLGVLFVLFVLSLTGLGVYVYFSITDARDLRSDLEKTAVRLDNITIQVELVQENLNVTNPCFANPCTNGLCQSDGDGDYICKCKTGWAGILCGKELSVDTNGTTISLKWETSFREDESKYNWFINYKESSTIQDEIHIYTYDNQTTFDPIQRLSYYRIEVYSIDYNQMHQLRYEESRFVQRHETSLDVTWDKYEGDENGYHVVLSRLNRPKSGRSQVQSGQAEISDLDPCVQYNLEIQRVDPEYRIEHTVQTLTTTTECSELRWRKGKSVVVSEWSGGKQELLVKTHCDQPDYFNVTIINPTCNNEPNVGEAIIDTESHSGFNSWHYKRGYLSSNHGSGRPYSPQLKYQAGRNDGNYIGETDGFYASMWFKMAELGDESSFEIAGGSSEGNDRVSTMIYITSYQQGINISAFEAMAYDSTCVPYGNCTSDFITVPIGIHLSDAWHRLEFELRSYPGDYNDTWTYWVDGGQVHSGGSYLNALMLESDNRYYKYVNRIMVKARNPSGRTSDPTIKGAYFDDVYYETFNWVDRDLILDSYFTSFEYD